MQDGTAPPFSLDPRCAGFLRDALTGLRDCPKRLPSKYFYDARGSELFDAICTLDEYYLTRTELAIQRRHAVEMAGCLGPECLVVEPGSGAGVKTRILLSALERPVAYVPVDISAGQLFRTAATLEAEFPGLAVLPVAADFTQPFRVPAAPHSPLRRAIYFPGSTIGNFDAQPAGELLTNLARVAGADGALLIGLDLQKDAGVIEAAYNDARGVTAQFNLNVLARMNRELGTDFDIGRFRHRAWYNRAAGRIEMHLESTEQQSVRLNGISVELAKGETICTEYSYKYDADEFARFAAQAGWRLVQQWRDDRDFFAVLYLTRM